MEEKRELRRQPDDHHFGSLLMLAVAAGASLGHLGSHEGAVCLPPRGSNSLKTDWQRHVLASSGYLELGMFDDAAMVLEEIAPEDKTRNEAGRTR